MSVHFFCISRGCGYQPLHKFLAALIVCLFFAAVFPGAANAQFFKFGKKKDPLPVVFNRTPTQAELVQHITNNNSKFRQLSSDLVVSLDGAPKLRGTMQLELPRRLRIKAGVMSMSQLGVDVGSNNQDFWVWTKVNLPNQKPAIFHANHEAFKNATSSVRQAIPLEPIWLLEGFGLIQFKATDKHVRYDRTPEGHLKLLTESQSPTGLTYRQTTIDPRHGTILQQALYDGSDNQYKLLAYTNSTNYKSFPKQGAVLPERVEMHLFQNGQDTKMVIETSDFQFDSLYGDPSLMWEMPTPQGVPAINLTNIR